MTVPCEHCMQLPTFKHVEQQQQPYLGIVQAIVAHFNEASPDRAFYKADFDALMVRLWAEQPDVAETKAYRTTRYGREGEAE